MYYEPALCQHENLLVIEVYFNFVIQYNRTSIHTGIMKFVSSHILVYVSPRRLLALAAAIFWPQLQDISKTRMQYDALMRNH